MDGSRDAKKEQRRDGESLPLADGPNDGSNDCCHDRKHDGSSDTLNDR